MKKNIFAALLFISMSFCSIAQPVLTQSNHVIPFLDSTLYYVADTNSVLNDTTGADIVIDYAYLRGYGVTQKAYYIDPTTTPQTSDFPTATLAEQTSLSTQNVIYSLSSSTEIKNLGFVADITGFGVTTAKYNTDPEEIIRFPFAYGDSYTDPYAGVFSVNTGFGTVNTNAAGNVTVQADAWGKLVLETITIDSVLRIKRVENMVTDPIVMPSPLPTISPITVDVSMVNYYKPSLSKAPLISFVVSSYSQNGSVVQSNKTILSQYPMSFVSVEEIKIAESISIFPNPTNGNSSLSIQLEKPTQVKIEVLNLLGQQVFEIQNKMLQSGKHNVNFELSGLSSGTYLVSILLNNKTKIAKKLILE